MRTDSQPAQRAAVLKLTLATAAEHPRRAALEAAIPAELREAIEAARPSEWLPITRTMALLETVWKVLPRDEFIDFYIRQIDKAQTDSAFGRFMSGAGRVFMRTPMSRLRHLPRGFDLAQREAGDMDIEPVGEHAAAVRLHSLPRILRNECYAISMIAPLRFAIAQAADDVRIDVDTRELSHGVVHYQIAWTERSGA
ncbi:hypothetical protein ACNOYE_01280 [Nannocystaceae bacterium ST9]